VQIFAGTLDLPQRSPNVADAKLAPFLELRRRYPRLPASLIEMACGLNASTASVWSWVHWTSTNIGSRRMIPSAPLPSCGISRQCREMNGKSASRRSCGCHAREMPSCCREACGPGRARTKCVIVDGIAPLFEISCDRSESAMLMGKAEITMNNINDDLILAARLFSRRCF